MIKINDSTILKNDEFYKINKTRNNGIVFENNNLDKSIPIVECISSNILNDFNIVLNDNNCSDNLFYEICEYLTNDGIKFATAKGELNINKDNTVIITLDQQYNSGSNIIFFAPYNNTRLGSSDVLTIAMKSAFDTNNSVKNDIMCGKLGFEDNNGNVNYMIPTETEKLIDDDLEVSFVTISLGTTYVDSKKIAKNIESGLLRFCHYINDNDKNADLIYRADSTDSVDEVAKYFNSSASELIKYNNIINNSFSKSQAIVNPYIQYIDAFNTDSEFTIESGKDKHI